MNRCHLAPYRQRWITALLLLLVVPAAYAAPDLQVQKITDSVYALVGPFGNRSAENLGNNATFGFIVTDEGVILIDAGGGYLGAEAIQSAIADVTTQPVKIVVNTGGQDHRWLGNGYFKEHGARIIASRRAVEDQKARARDQLMVLDNLVGLKGMEGTTPVYADEVFDDRLDIALGGVRLELHHVGQAHTPGDLFAWLPAQSVMFSGDIVYIGRMLGIMPHSNSRSWIETFNAMAGFGPSVVVPGHGPASTLDQARADTLDYLVTLRNKISIFMEAGRGIEEVGTLDQSAFAHLVSYDELKGRNAQQVFQEMEWE
ncbi:MAG: MBL fold metallo-hydrolase [Chromatiaceae bacterium]|nr:MBL fold metallo-hydrolase [Chromatiaceae bacterium]MCP5440976.1 MBL fold metallo-hydrolase [Chromatiaceae bacterium]